MLIEAVVASSYQLRTGLRGGGSEIEENSRRLGGTRRWKGLFSEVLGLAKDGGQQVELRQIMRSLKDGDVVLHFASGAKKRHFRRNCHCRPNCKRKRLQKSEKIDGLT